MNKYLVLIVVLPACIGSKYQVPVHHMPQSYTFGSSHNAPVDLAAWWRTFDDEHLNELIERAVANNYSLAIAVEQITQARALYKRQEANLFPEIDIVAQANRTRFSTAVAQNSFIQNNNNKRSFFQLGFDGIWEIDFWGKIWREAQAQFYEFQAQIEQMHDVYIILLADVSRTYIDICSLQAQHTFIRDQIIALKELVQLQKDLFHAGLGSEIEVAIQEQALAEREEQLENIIKFQAQSTNQLAVLLGENPEGFAMPARDTVPLAQHALSVDMPSELVRRRPDIRRAERELAAAHERVGQAVAEWFPSFSLLGGLTSQASTGSTWFTNKSLSWTIGPSVRWPLINFGRIKATIKARESSKRQAILAYSETIITALQEVEDFLVAYLQNKEQFALNSFKLEQSNLQVALEQSKFQAGLASKIAYLNAVVDRIGTSIEQILLAQAISSSLISVYKALGGGW